MESFFDGELCDGDLSTPTPYEYEVLSVALEGAGQIPGFNSNDNNGELERLMMDGSQMNPELALANSMSSFPSPDTVHKQMGNYIGVPPCLFSNVHQFNDEYVNTCPSYSTFY
jgi:hypothetical protein